MFLNHSPPPDARRQGFPKQWTYPRSAGNPDGAWDDCFRRIGGMGLMAVFQCNGKLSAVNIFVKPLNSGEYSAS